MADYNLTESARWQQETDKLVGELHAGADKALAEAAARGFAAPPGATLGAILAAGQDVKGKLTEANGKIYDDRRKVLFEQDEFAMKIIVQVSKLAMELYRDELMNALAIEQAEAAAVRDQGLADVVRLNAEVDARQVAIIQSRAEAERRVTVLKAALVEAEAVTLISERALITAQLATAEKKLEIIDSIYQVLAAEQLVLAAENRRAATLELLLAAQEIVAGIKREMVPFYIEKASARQDLAVAITNEIPIKEAIEKLGYDRIELKDAEEAANHQAREAEEEVEIARLAWTRANKATEFARAQSRRLLQEYANIIRAEILEKKKALEMDGVDFKLETSLERKAIDVNDDIAVVNHNIGNLTDELISILVNMESRALDQALTVRDGALRISQSFTQSNISRKIVEGFVVGPMPTASIG